MRQNAFRLTFTRRLFSIEVHTLANSNDPGKNQKKMHIPKKDKCNNRGKSLYLERFLVDMRWRTKKERLIVTVRINARTDGQVNQCR